MTTHHVERVGQSPDGTPVDRVSLAGGGLRADILTYGAIVQSLRIEGLHHPLVLGSPDLNAYLGPMRHFGALVGRFANRIKAGRFSLDGKNFQIPCNWIGKHALHGGPNGTARRVWSIDALSGSSVRLGLVLADGDMGFPGELSVQAEISLTEESALCFDIRAKTTEPTPCSFAHHGYFNLDGSPDITGHLLQIDAPNYLPVDDELIPLGDPRPVDGTIFDFRTPCPIGRRGLDHNFCLSGEIGEFRPVARLHAPEAGLSMTVKTTEAGLQVYDGGNIHKDGLPGLEGRTYVPFAGIALETQAWPDAPNRPDFPSAILYPGGTYHHRVHYVFAFD